MPYMEDAYYLEAQVLAFLTELITIKKPAILEAVFHMYSLSFNDEFIKKFVSNLVHCCGKKLIQQGMRSDFESSIYLAVIYEICSRDRFKAAWLQSPYFCQDLEMMYSLHLLTTEEWQKHLKVIYHPLLSKTLANRVKYENNFSKI